MLCLEQDADRGSSLLAALQPGPQVRCRAAPGQGAGTDIVVARLIHAGRLFDRKALQSVQEIGDAAMAGQCRNRAFPTDFSPILAMPRMHKGASIDPLAAYCASGGLSD